MEDEDANEESHEFEWSGKKKSSREDGRRSKKSRIELNDGSNLEEIDENLDEEFDAKEGKKKKKKNANKRKLIKEKQSSNVDEDKAPPKKRGRKPKALKGEIES